MKTVCSYRKVEPSLYICSRQVLRTSRISKSLDDEIFFIKMSIDLSTSSSQCHSSVDYSRNLRKISNKSSALGSQVIQLGNSDNKTLIFSTDTIFYIYFLPAIGCTDKGLSATNDNVRDQNLTERNIPTKMDISLSPIQAQTLSPQISS